MGNVNQGILVVIEGMDGASKRTQSELLQSKLQQSNVISTLVSFPNYDDSSSALVKSYLNGNFGRSKEIIDRMTFLKQICTFYAVDRVSTFFKTHTSGTTLYEDYMNGAFIICDRYTTSNILHQTSNIENVEEKYRLVDWIEDFEYSTLGLPKPTVVFYLDVTPEVALKNISQRYNGNDNYDIHENYTHLRMVYENNKKIVPYCKWVPINCVNSDGNMRTREEISEDIFAEIQKILKQ